MLKRLIIYTFLLFSTTTLFSQEWTAIEKENKQKADNFFEEEQYEEALPLYSQLLSIHGRDVDLNLKYAICLVELNRDLKEAKKYLDFVKNKQPDNPLVYYYLGRILHLQYKFTNAIAYYQKFMELAPSRLVKKYDPEQKIRMCRNGEQLINFVSELIVLENKVVKRDNFWYSYRLGDFGGKLIVTPKDFKSKGDIKADYKGITFMWNSSLAFFASHGESKKGNLDLYQATLTDNGQWIIERMPPPINTLYDEDYPYLAPDGKTFYFASKGQNSMGGYDIFVSVYDSSSKTWSKPINLDFPINTPYDDLLYVTDKENKYAYFASQRSTDKSHINVYKILVNKNPKRRKTEGLEDIYEQAKLNVTPLAEVETQSNNKEEDVANNLASNDQTTVDSSFFNFKPIDTKKMVLEDLKKQIDEDVAMLESQDNKMKNYLAQLSESVKSKEKKRTTIEEEIKKYLNTGQQDPDELESKVDKYTQALNEELAAMDLYKQVKNKYQVFNKDVQGLVKEYENYKTIADKEDLYNKIQEKRKQATELMYASGFDVETEKDYWEAKKNEYISQNNQIEKKILQYRKDIEDTKKEIELKNKEKENPDLTTEEKNNIENEIKQLKDYINGVVNDIKAEKSKQIRIKNNIVYADQKLKLLASLENENGGNNSDISELQDIDNKIENIKNNLNEFYDKEEAKAGTGYSKLYAFTESGLSKNLGENEIEKAKIIYNNAESKLLAENQQSETRLNTAENIGIDNEKSETENFSGNEIAKTGNNKQENIDFAENTNHQKGVDGSVNQNNTGNATNVSQQDSLSNIRQNDEYLTQNNSATESDLKQDNTENIPEENTNVEVVNAVSDTTFANGDTAVVAENNVKAEDVNSILSENNDENQINTTYIEKDTPEHIVSQLDELQGVKELSPELSTDSTEPEAEKQKKLLVASSFVKSKMKNEKLQLNALQASLDKGNIIAEKEEVKSKIKYLKKQILADSLLLSQIEKNLMEEEHVPGEETIAEDKLVSTFVDKKITEDKSISKVEKDIYTQKSTMADSLLAVGKDKEKALNTKNLVNDFLYNKLYASLDSVSTGNSKNGKVKYLVSNAKFLYDLAIKIEQDAQQEKAKEDKLKKLETAASLKKNAMKNLLLAKDQVSDTTVSKPLELPLISLTPEDKEELLQNIEKAETEKRLLADYNLKMKNLANAIIEDTLADKSKVKKITKTLNKLKKEVINKYNLVLNADSSIYTINEKYLTQLSNEIPPQKVEKFTSYRNLAETYFNKATTLKLKAAVESDENKKMELLTESEKSYNKALNAQNLALNTLIYGNESVSQVLSSQANYSSPLVIASNISESNVEFNINKKNLIARSYNTEEKDNWYYAEDNDKELNDLVKTLNQAEDLIRKDEDIIRKSKNPDKVKSTEKDLKYLEKTRISIIDDIAGLLTENSQLKQKLLESKINELKQESTLSPERKKLADILENKARIYNETADKLLDNLKQVSSNDVKTRLIIAAKQYKDKATDAMFKELALYKKKGGVSDEDIASLVSKKRNIAALEDYSSGFNADKIIAMYNKPPKRQTSQKQILAQASTHEQNITIPQNFILVNATDIMRSGETYNISVMLDTTAYSSLAKLKVHYPGYVNVKLVKYPMGADTITTDTTINLIWIKYNGGNQNNVVLSLKPQNIFAYNDTIFFEFSYLKNNKIEKIVKKLPVKFEEAQLAMTSGQETETASNKENLSNKNENPSQSEGNNFITKNTSEDNGQNTIDTSATVQSESVIAQNTQQNEPENNAVNDKNTINEESGNTNELIVNENSDNAGNKNLNGINTASNSQIASIENNSNVPFAVGDRSFYSDENPIPVNPPLPNGIVYKIQIGAYYKLVDNKTFKVRPVSVEKAPGSKYYKYLFGQFSTFDAAVAGLKKVRSMGYPQAFIVAYKDGKRVPVYIARNEQYATPGYKDLASAEITAVNNGTEVTNKQTASSTIANNSAPLPKDKDLFTVQIGVFKKTPSPAFFAAFDNIYYEKTPYGFTRYFTGIFNSYAEAVATRNLARRKGIKDAFIVKYSNGKRLLQPVQTQPVVAEVKQQNKQAATTTPVEISDTTGLFFSVQIGAFRGNVSLDELLKGIESVRGKYVGFIKSGGYTIFVAGKFKSYKKARDFMIILKNEGLKDAFVIAVKDGKKIPVSSALKVLGR